MPEKKKKKSSKDRKRDADESVDPNHKRPKVEQLTESDYFVKNAPFTRWLRKKKGVYFDQLSADRSRKLFKEFVSKWNDGALSSKYYDMDPVKPKIKERTGYQWAFVDKLGKGDKKGLQHLSETVDASATHDVLSGTGASVVTTTAALSTKHPSRRTMFPAAPDPATLRAYNAELQRKDHRDYRKHTDLVAEELSGGKATGFERKLEKKAEAKAVRAARDASPDGPGGDPYSTSDFASEVAKRNARFERKRANKKEAALEKLKAHSDREQAKMQELLQLAKNTRQEGALYHG